MPYRRNEIATLTNDAENLPVKLHMTIRNTLELSEIDLPNESIFGQR
ncbi:MULTISPECIES: hypothetical protein [Acidithrix]|nr:MULTISPECIES: hypothetical protein [Acidithrix]CAG4929856.1 unnamed protein product [Acidithrix sp. C25]